MTKKLTPAYRKDILKIKDFFEDDYQIHDYKVERMLVNCNGSLVHENLLSSVMIMHRGNPVWVGSGFSLNERRSLVSDPQRLLGSIVTVRYYEETAVHSKDKVVHSLRFPTLKAFHHPDQEPL